MGKGLEQTFLQEDIQMTNSEIMKKILNGLSYQGNGNQNHDEIPLHIHYYGYYPKLGK